jgi:O-antigen/teichoic acid export membrane protein
MIKRLKNKLYNGRFKELFATDGTLSQKAARGGVWVVAIKILSKLFGLARTVVLAHLLAPSDFGLMGIAFVTISALTIFTDTGFNAALIQRKENTDDYLDVAWSIQVFRGILLFLVLIVSAPYVAEFFDEPRASLIIQIIAFSLLLSGFSNIATVYFEKELNFHKRFFYTMATTLTDIFVSIIFAVILRSVWALVFGLLASSIVGLILSYILQKYRPKFKFDRNKFCELFNFSKWLVGSGILYFLINQGDDIFLGKFLGVAALGMYQIAYKISNFASSEISSMFTQVAFPVLSKLQNSMNKFKDAYVMMNKAMAVVVFPLAAGICLLAYEFTKIFLGDRWLPIVPAMQLLALLSAFRAIEYGTAFKALGKPKIILQLSLVRLAIIVVCIYPLTKYMGITGTALSIVIATFPLEFVWMHKINKLLDFNKTKFIEMLGVPVLASTFMAVVVFYIKHLLFSNSILHFFVSVFSGLISYLLILLWLDRKLKFGLIKIISFFRTKLVKTSIT